MSSIQPALGQAALKRRSVGRLIFYPSGTAAGYDAGNLQKWSHNDKRERTQSMSNDLGAAAAVVVREDVHTLGYGYKFTVDEWTDFLRLLVANGLGTQAADTQAATTSAATVTITTPQAGRTYDLGMRDVTITSVTVTSGSVVLVAGTHYVVDRPSGQITFLATKTDTAVVFTATALDRRKFTPGGVNPTVYGSFLFFEYDQMATSVRAEHSFTGNIVVASQNGEDEKSFRDASLEVTCWSAPVIKER